MGLRHLRRELRSPALGPACARPGTGVGGSIGGGFTTCWLGGPFGSPGSSTRRRRWRMSDQVVSRRGGTVRSVAARWRRGCGARGFRARARTDVHRVACVRVLQHRDLKGMDRDRGGRARPRSAGDGTMALRPAIGVAGRAAVARSGPPSERDSGLRAVPAGRGVLPLRIRVRSGTLLDPARWFTPWPAAPSTARSRRRSCWCTPAGCRAGHFLSPAACCSPPLWWRG